METMQTCCGNLTSMLLCLLGSEFEKGLEVEGDEFLQLRGNEDRWAWYAVTQPHNSHGLYVHPPCSAAASRNMIVLLLIAIQSGRAQPAKHSKTQVLRWCRENGCPWTKDVCDAAAFGGHLGVMQWCKANGCEWSEATCVAAAYGGHLAVLKWCREHGCSWQADRACQYAAWNGHLDVLRWCMTNGCSWNKLICEAAARGGHLKVREGTLGNSVCFFSCEKRFWYSGKAVLGGGAAAAATVVVVRVDYDLRGEICTTWKIAGEELAQSSKYIFHRFKKCFNSILVM